MKIQLISEIKKFEDPTCSKSELFLNAAGMDLKYIEYCTTYFQLTNFQLTKCAGNIKQQKDQF